MSREPGAGARRLAPALIFFALIVAATAVAAPRPDPDLVPAKGDRLARAADGVVAALRSQSKYPPTPEAVELMLRIYAGSRNRGDLDRAVALARRMRDESPSLASPQGFYRTARAGGPTLAEGESLFGARRELMRTAERATTDTYAGFVQDMFLRAEALRDTVALADAFRATGRFFDARTRRDAGGLVLLPGGSAAKEASLSDYTEAVRLCVLAIEASGSEPLRANATQLARGLIRNFWDEKTTRFDVPATDRVDRPAVVVPLLNARAALALWRMGELTGDPLLTGRGKRALNSVLDEALASKDSAPAVALAALATDSPPVRMTVVGAPSDPAATALREAAFFTFEPRKVLVSLDPSVDAARIHDLGLRPAGSPALFVQYDGFRSPAVTDPGGVERALRGVLDEAAKTRR
jgi:hypothetical protein